MRAGHAGALIITLLFGCSSDGDDTAGGEIAETPTPRTVGGSCDDAVPCAEGSTCQAGTCVTNGECEPLNDLECACPDGAIGVARCRADGTYTDCKCDEDVLTTGGGGGASTSGAGGTSEPTGCLEGLQEACSCSDGSPGARTCSGGRWGSCQCGTGNGQCGNGVIDLGEQCDGTNLNGETCASVTMGAVPTGTLSCTAACVLDVSGCVAGAACVPGASSPCVCPDGSPGARTCSANGQPGPCVCATTPAGCDATGLSGCDACIQDTCCDEWLACASDPCPNETQCIFDCVAEVAANVGFASELDLANCAAACAESSGVIDVTTDDLITCIRSSPTCGAVCFGF